MANDFMGYILAALQGTGQGVDQLQQRDRQRGLDAQKAQDDALQRQVTQTQLDAARAKPTRRAVGTLEIAGPDGKPRLANRYEDGAIEPTDFSPYKAPEAPRAPVPGTPEWKAMREWEFGQQSALQAKADERRARLEAAKEARRNGQAGSRPMSPPSAEQFAQSVADRAVAAAGGDIRKAAQLATEDPAGRAAYKQGLSTRHFRAAALAFTQDQQAFKKRMQGGGDFEAALAGALGGDGGSPPGPAAMSQQQRDWDAAAAELRSQGKDPESVIGPRP